MNRLSTYVCKRLTQYTKEEIDQAIDVIRRGKYIPCKKVLELVSEYLTNKTLNTMQSEEVIENGLCDMKEDIGIRIARILTRIPKHDAMYYDYFEWMRSRFPHFGYESEYNK